MTRIDELDARLLEVVQRRVPLASRPFEEIGRQLAVPADEVMARLSRLKSEGIVREISGILEASALGYQSVLVAFRVRQECLDAVGEAVARHPGVSHCYSRDGEFSLWFTFSVGPESEIEREVTSLAALEGVESHMTLPALKVFKIGVFLRFADGPVSEPPPTPPSQGGARMRSALRRGTTGGLGELGAEDQAAVRALQEDLPLVEAPFAELAARAGLAEDDLLKRAHLFIERGIMRRYAAVLRHVRAGYEVNAMICWEVGAQAVDEIGKTLAAEPCVSHCYQRAGDPEWPYALYTMVHCRTDEELADAVTRLAESVGNSPHIVLRTLREFKKERVRY